MKCCLKGIFYVIAYLSRLLLIWLVIATLILVDFANEQYNETIYYQEQQLRATDKGALFLNPGRVYNKGSRSGVSNELFAEYGGFKPEADTFDTKDYIDSIKLATNDNQVTGIVINLTKFSADSLSIAQEFAEALLDFKKSGKPVISYSTYYVSSSGALVAAASSQHFNDTKSYLDIYKGSISQPYYGEAFEKYKVTSSSVRSGSYDPLVDGDLASDFTPDVRKTASQIVDVKWDEYVKLISKFKNHNYTSNDFSYQKIIAGLEAHISGSQQQEKLGLITKRVTDLQLEDELKKIFGQDSSKHWRRISSRAYINKVHNFNKPNYKEPHIAVYNLNGSMSNKNSSSSRLVVNGTKIARDIVNIVNNPKSNAAGIMIKINSSGGQIEDAQTLSSAIELAKTKIPVVVYAEDYLTNAAYLATVGADKIIANSATLVGGISVSILGSLHIDEIYNFLGIHTQALNSSTKLSAVAGSLFLDIPSLSSRSIAASKITPELISYNQGKADAQHSEFIYQVDKYRIINNLNDIREGQYLVGNQALQEGLVDKISNYDDALNELRSLIEKKRKDGTSYAMAAYSYDKISSKNKTLQDFVTGVLGDYSDIALEQVAVKQNTSLAKLVLDLQLSSSSPDELLSICNLCVVGN